MQKRGLSAWFEETKNPFDNGEVVSVRQWLAVLLLMLIPLMNVAVLLGWAMSSKEKLPASMVNWARAMVIMTVIVISVMIPCIFVCLKVLS